MPFRHSHLEGMNTDVTKIDASTSRHDHNFYYFSDIVLFSH